MISIRGFEDLVRDVLGTDLSTNPAQRDGVSHEGEDVLMLVAGPGSGKTTVLVLRALRHVLVDDILPEQLLITTFTRKAAKELRTRWLDWGTQLLEYLSAHEELRQAVGRIDLNRCRIDTLDSVAEQALTEHRLPGETAPILVEASAAKLILKRASFRDAYREHRNDLDAFLARYTFTGEPPRNRGEALSVAKSICARLVQDRVELGSYSRASPANAVMVNILQGYLDRLRQTNLFDFATLELEFLRRISDGRLRDWLQGVAALLVDEYQDTNPLQEAIYFAIISASSPAVTVVGDDDQSMYRFRGGSVELFTQFAPRCAAATGRRTRRVDMVANYRSSAQIISFCNSHVLGDPDFGPARILPAKPEVTPHRGEAGIPVLGMFRQDPVDLAESLASWLAQAFESRRVALGDFPSVCELLLTEGNDLGDCVLLAHSVEEVRYSHYDHVAELRFAGHFRAAMAAMGLSVFNPRGRSLRTIASVQQLLGLVLLCLDPDGDRLQAAFATGEAQYFLTAWRAAGASLIAQDPAPSNDGGLRGFVAQWQSASRGTPSSAFPPDWPALELLFKLVAWIPGFQNDPEHQVWLEAITRTVANAGMASRYGMQILRDSAHRDRSRETFIRDAILPIAENEVDVDEDIMPSVPRNRLQLMTIHQSKGLEFPLVVVDVGSHFATNHRSHAFRRFPRAPSNVATIEDDVEPHLSAPLRIGRSLIDRTFDDLTRLYYVAYSRPQCVLMLVGCESCLRYGSGRNLTGVVPNIALGWARDGTWPWRQPVAGRPPIRVSGPMLLI